MFMSGALKKYLLIFLHKKNSLEGGSPSSVEDQPSMM